MNVELTKEILREFFSTILILLFFITPEHQLRFTLTPKDSLLLQKKLKEKLYIPMKKRLKFLSAGSE